MPWPLKINQILFRNYEKQHIINDIYIYIHTHNRISYCMNYDNFSLGPFGLSLFLLKLKTETENTVAN